MMNISLIAAMTEEGVIGKDGGLPWNIPEELQYFRTMTLNKPVIMGRRTFESMGKRPLANRPNIIFTRDPFFVAPNCTIVRTVEEVLKQCERDDEIMVIGGTDIYKLFLPLASRLYMTIIHERYVGDTYFPNVDWTNWILKEEQAKKDFTIKIYDRKL